MFNNKLNKLLFTLIFVIDLIKCNVNNTSSNLNKSEYIHLNDNHINSVSIVVVKHTLTSILCVLMIVSTIIGNLLVILSVLLVKKLHAEENANNYLIVNLAISDLLVGILVMPFALYTELNDAKWHLPAILCDLWTLSDVLLCTASILNLVAISVDRYFIILHSFRYTQRRNAKLILLMIIIVWLLSGVTSIPPLFGWGRPSQNLAKIQICLVSQELNYQIYATLMAFYIPLIILTILYLNIYRAALRISKKDNETNMRLVSSYKTIISASEPKESIKKSEDTTLTNFSTSNHFSSNEHLQSQNSLRKCKRRLTQLFNNILEDYRKKSSCSNSNTTQHVNKHQKATRTLGIIMGCFILCWLPFFILAIIKPIRIAPQTPISVYIPAWFDSLLLWLGYFNSTLNPIIYAIFNREFRRPFLEILCFRCKNINERIRNEERKRLYLTNINTNNQMRRDASVNKMVRAEESLEYEQQMHLITDENNNNINNNTQLLSLDKQELFISLTQKSSCEILTALFYSQNNDINNLNENNFNHKRQSKLFSYNLNGTNHEFCIKNTKRNSLDSYLNFLTKNSLSLNANEI